MINKKYIATLAISAVIISFLLITFYQKRQNANAPVTKPVVQETQPEYQPKKQLTTIENDKIIKKDVISTEIITGPKKQVANNYSSFDDNDLQYFLDLLELGNSDISSLLTQYREAGQQREWMANVRTELGALLSEKEYARIAENQLLFLAITDKFDEAYLNRSDITFSEYKESMTTLYNWSQKIYKEILTDEEYEILFKETKDNTDAIVKSVINLLPEFQIFNPDTTISEIEETIPLYKLDMVAELSKAQKSEEWEINRMVNAEEIKPTEAAFLLDESYRSYLNGAKEVLDDEEVQLIFTSLEKALE